MTPIPRTAAMTVYGDLDVTVLDELPPGRTPVRTEWLRSPMEEAVERTAERHRTSSASLCLFRPGDPGFGPVYRPGSCNKSSAAARSLHGRRPTAH